MAQGMRTSKAGLDLIRTFEGFRAEAVRLSNGRHMIGYGHTRSARAGLTITEAEASEVLSDYDLPPIERALAERVPAPLNQNEFDALVSLIWNIGEENFFASDIHARLVAGERLAAADAFAAWRKARVNGRVIVVDALVRRRAAEKALFLTVPDGAPIAPTPLIRPQVDLAVAIMTPREPAEVVVPDNVEPEPWPLAPRDPQEAAGTPAPSRPEEAARAVKERLTRILGEAPEAPAAPATSEAPSVDEITRAVSALAGGEESAAPSEAPSEPSAPQPSDAPPPEPGAETGHDGATASLKPLDEARPGRRTIHTVIDDLARPDLPGDARQRFAGASAPRDPVSTWLYGALAALGLLIAGWGVLAPGSAGAAGGEMPGLAGVRPFAVILGALLFIIMGYYTWRALQDRD